MATSYKALKHGSIQVYPDKVLGVGSYGKVCLARCGQLPCAAKLLHETMFESGDPGRFQFAERFEQECKFLSAIRHPNIVQYLDSVRNPRLRSLTFLMELMDENLTKFLERATGPLPYHVQLNICNDVALALSYLHFNAIIHRDLSGNNVMLAGEGSRAKVTDFGMSKLVDTISCMEKQTLCPGTNVYMPPEALTSPPHYTSKLDCFSHGVLTIQIITRKFPTPGDANKYIEDPKYPTGRLLLQFPEKERRKKDIELIKPDHSLLPIALQCLRDKETERPTADELCERLAMLKMQKDYTESLKQVQDQVTVNQRLKEQLAKKNQLILKERADHRKELEREKHDYLRLLAEKETIIKNLQDKATKIDSIYMTIDEESMEGHIYTTVNKTAAADTEKLKAEVVLQTDASISEMDSQVLSASGPAAKIRWRKGKPAPQWFNSRQGSAVLHNNLAYFSNYHKIFSIRQNVIWTELQCNCKFELFSMVILDNKLTTVGGQGLSGGGETNALLTLFSHNLTWQEILPPMPTRRTLSACVTIKNHLVVVGGQSSNNLTSAVEVLDMGTLQWSTVASIPKSSHFPSLTVCNDCFYLGQGSTVHSCFIASLLTSSGPFEWTKLPNVPAISSSLVTLKGHLVVLGGCVHSVPISAIHCYDIATNTWNVIGNLSRPQYCALAVSTSPSQVVIVGGYTTGCYGTNDTYTINYC